MEKVNIIVDNTLGMLQGRDCIYIDSVSQNGKGDLIIEGEINGHLAAKIQDDKWIPFKLVFHHVIAYFTCEIDTYCNAFLNKCLNRSSFNWIENSRWPAKLHVRKDYKHYQLFTYDDIFDILAESYELNCDLANARLMQ